MKKTLFEIYNWKRENDDIIVEVENNKYSMTDTIIIPEFKFEMYLKRHDRLYYETHDISTGQHDIKSHKMDLNEYFDYTQFHHICEDLYDYISIYFIDFNKSWQITQNAIQSLISHFNL